MAAPSPTAIGNEDVGVTAGFSYGRTSNIPTVHAASSVRPRRNSTASTGTTPSFTTASLASQSSSASRQVTSSSSRQPYFPPPGLSTATSPYAASGSNLIGSRANLKSQRPRHARVEHEPIMPAAAQWLLHTTPPPPPQYRTQSQWSTVNLHNDVHGSNHGRSMTATQRGHGDSNNSGSSSKLSWGRKRLVALGLAAAPEDSHHSLNESFNTLSIRQEPDRVQLKLGGGNGQPNVIVVPNRSRTSTSSRAGRLDSRTEADRLPVNWQEYREAYARSEIDIEDPPFPPIAISTLTSITDELSQPSPYQSGAFDAPLSNLEHVRQKMLASLDLLGQGRSESESSPSSAAMAPGFSATSSKSSSSPSHMTARDSLFSTTGRRDSTPASSIYASPSLPFPTHPTSQPGKPPPQIAGASAPGTRRSLQNHPALLHVLAHSRRLFGHPRATMISVLESDRQILLATEGMPEMVDSLPRQSSLCAHTVLNGEKGLIILDTQRDWRFRNNLLSTVLNARFYAGMPVFGPPNPELEEEAGGRIAIGTVAIVDDKPRIEFSSAERAKLRALAADVSNEIAAWARERRNSTTSTSASSYIEWQAKMAAHSGPPPAASAGYGRRGSKSDSLPPTPPGSIRRPSVPDETANSLVGEGAIPSPLSTMPEEAPAPHAKPSKHRRHHSGESNQAAFRGESDSAASTTSSARRRAVFPSNKVRGPPTTPSSTRRRSLSTQQKLFDSATRALGNGLDLQLVYLVALDLSAASKTTDPPLTLLSSHGLDSASTSTTTQPSFDPALHLKALRAPEGGLLFKNPAFAQGQAQPSTTSTSFASGILLPVTEHQNRTSGQRTGWVLAGYTKDPEREFGEDELSYFLQVVGQLAKVVTWATANDLA